MVGVVGHDVLGVLLVEDRPDVDGFFFFFFLSLSEDRGRRVPSEEGVPIVRCTPSAPNKAALYSCSWFLIYFVSLSL